MFAQAAHGQRIAQQPSVDGCARCRHAQGAGDQFAQPREVHRFGQEVEGAGLEGVDRRFEAAVGGNHGHRQVWGALLDMLHQLKTGAVRQAHVGQAQVEGLTLQQRLGFAEVTGAEGVEFHPSQGDFQEFADIRLVVDDQDFLPWAHVQLCFRP
ncbi:hypothetical protein D3C84_743130 [compost metagenome]